MKLSARASNSLIERCLGRAAMLLACGWPALTASGQDAWTVEQIGDGLKFREHAVQNFSVRSRLQKARRDPISGQFATFKFVIDQTVDSEDRVRYQLLGQRPGVDPRTEQPIAVQYQEIFVYDGETGRNMIAGEDGQYRMGGVFADNRASWPVDVRRFLTYGSQSPLSAYFERSHVSIANQQEFDGHRLVVCRAERRTEDGFKYAELHELWVDPARGFIVPKRIAFGRRKDGEWVEYRRVECYDYEEPAPGIWMPSRARYVSHALSKAGEATLNNRTEIEFSDWRVNEPLAPNTFTLEFAKGVHVYDKITGKDYTHGLIDNVHLDAQAARAQQLAMELEDMPSNQEMKTRLLPEKRAKIWVYVLAVSGIGLMVAGVGLWARRRWTRTRQAA